MPQQQEWEYFSGPPNKDDEWEYLNPIRTQPEKEREKSWSEEILTLPNLARFGLSAVGDILTVPSLGTSPFIGGAAGEGIARWMEGKEFDPSIMALEGALNYLPGAGKLERTGLKEVAKYGAKSFGHGAAQGLAGTFPRHQADKGNLWNPSEWEMPSGQEFAGQTIGGGVIGGAVGTALGGISSLRGKLGAVGDAGKTPATDINLNVPPPAKPRIDAATFAKMRDAKTAGLPDRIVFEKTPDAATLNWYLNNGYVQGGIDPATSRPFIVRKQGAQPVAPPSPVAAPPTQDVEGGAAFDADQGFTVPADKLSESKIKGYLEQGWKLVGKDAQGRGVFKRFAEEDEGTSNWMNWLIEWGIKKFRRENGRDPSISEEMNIRRNITSEEKANIPVIPDYHEANMMDADTANSFIEDATNAVNYWKNIHRNFVRAGDQEGIKTAIKNQSEAQTTLQELLTRAGHLNPRVPDHPNKVDADNAARKERDRLNSLTRPMWELLINDKDPGRYKNVEDLITRTTDPDTINQHIEGLKEWVKEAQDTGDFREATFLSDLLDAAIDHQRAIQGEGAPSRPFPTADEQLENQIPWTEPTHEQIVNSLYNEARRLGLNPDDYRSLGELEDAVDRVRDHGIRDPMSRLPESDEPEDGIRWTGDEPQAFTPEEQQKFRDAAGMPPPDPAQALLDDLAKLKGMHQPGSPVSDEYIQALADIMKKHTDNIINRHGPMPRGVDEVVEDLESAFNMGEHDIVPGLLEELNTMIASETDIQRLLNHMGTFSALESNIQDPAQKAIFGDLHQKAYSKYIKSIRPQGPDTAMDEGSPFDEKGRVAPFEPKGTRESLSTESLLQYADYFRRTGENPELLRGIENELRTRGINPETAEVPPVDTSVYKGWDWGPEPEIPPTDKWDEVGLDPKNEEALRKLREWNSLPEDVRRAETGPPIFGEDIPITEGGIDVGQMRQQNVFGPLREADISLDAPRPLEMGQQELPTGPHGEMFPREIPETDMGVGHPTEMPVVPNGPQPMQSELLPVPPDPYGQIGRVKGPLDIVREPYESPNAPPSAPAPVPPVEAKKKPSIMKEAYNFSRGVTTTADLSASMRQGLPLIFTKQWWTSWNQQLKALGSEGAYQKTLTDIKNRPLFQNRVDYETGKVTKSWAAQAGIKIMDVVENLNKREESIASNWTETGGFLGPAAPIYAKTVGRGARASNRAYTAYLNQLRADSFESLLKDAKRGFDAGKAGYTDPYTDLKFAKEIADFVNTATGRGPMKLARPTVEGGKLGLKESSLEQHAKALTGILFSPRLMFSRMRMLNPATYMMASPFVRKQYLKAAISTAGAWGTISGLAAAAGAAGIADIEVSTDTNSADFGKIRIRNTRLDPAAGFQQYFVALSRLISGHTTSSATQKDFELGQGYRAETRRDVIERFTANKLHPVLKFGYDIVAASERQPFHFGDRTAQLFVPLIAQDVYELWKEDPTLIPYIIPPAIIGMGTQTYDKGESKGKFIPPENDFLFQGGELWGEPRPY